MKARKKPIVIDVFLMQNDTPIHSVKRWVEKFGDSFENNFNFDYGSLKVKTLEGTSYEVTTEDVIIRGVKGEYYPCKKDIFESTYEIVENEG